MVYTNNVPQANQQIAATQPTINANFDYIQKAVGQEHNFTANDTDPTHTYHLKASMPNTALAALPASTNGQYRVDGGIAKYFDGATDWWLNTWTGVIAGNYTPTSSSTFNDITLLPANVTGLILFYRQSSGGYTQTGQFCTDGTRSFGYSNRIKINGSSDDYPIELRNTNASSLQLQGRAFNSGYTGITYNFVVLYRNT
jgi:hypothetical protein